MAFLKNTGTPQTPKGGSVPILGVGGCFGFILVCPVLPEEQKRWQRSPCKANCEDRMGAAPGDQATLKASSRGPTHTGQSLPFQVRPVRRGGWGCSPPGPSASLSYQVLSNAERKPGLAQAARASTHLPAQWGPVTHRCCPPGPSRHCSKSKNLRAKEVYLSV